MNYQPAVLDHVFTLAHEAGHSMHSHLSASHQPFLYYNYTIFVAEVASTFNEQLLSHYLMQRAKSDRRTGVSDQSRDRRHPRHDLSPDDVRRVRTDDPRPARSGRAARRSNASRPNTGNCSSIISGPTSRWTTIWSWNAFASRISIAAFYVYKYATGLSAAIALSQRVLGGGRRELDDYLGFLKGGCSKFPLDLLRDAGVDMEKPGPVDTALAHFSSLVEQLEELL